MCAPTARYQIPTRLPSRRTEAEFHSHWRILGGADRSTPEAAHRRSICELHPIRNIVARKWRLEGVGADMDDNQEVFSTFVVTHTQSLYRTAFVLTRDRDAANDLLQEAWVAIYRKWPRVRTARSPLAYARRCLVNTFLSQTRRAPPASLSYESVSESMIERDTPRAMDEAIAEQRALVYLLATLPRRQQVALVLRYLYDYSDDELAQSLRCRPSTVRSLISRGLHRLQERAQSNEIRDPANTFKGRS